ILLAIGIAQHSGLLAAAIRKLFGTSPAWMLPYVVGFVGVVASIMADSAFVVIPPLAALVFKAAGRHPVAGLLGGFAAAGAGYSTNIFPTSLDALFAGITTSVMDALPGYEFTAVNPVSNWFFNIASSIVLGFVARFIIGRLIDPRLARAGVARCGSKGALPPGATGMARTGLLLPALPSPASPWRNGARRFLPASPLLSSIVGVVVAYCVVVGTVYAITTGTLRNSRDAV